MSDDDAWKNARSAYQHAWEESKKAGDEMLFALQKADLVSSEEARQLFKRQAEKAFVAYENWRQAAEIAVETMQEIVSGYPRAE